MMSENILRFVFYTMTVCLCGFVFLHSLRRDPSSQEELREDQAAIHETTKPGSEADVVFSGIPIENQPKKLPENNENDFTLRSIDALSRGRDKRFELGVDNQVKWKSAASENLIPNPRKGPAPNTDLEANSRTDGLAQRRGRSRPFENKSKFDPPLARSQADNAATNMDAEDEKRLSLAPEISAAPFLSDPNSSNTVTQSNDIWPSTQTESLNAVSPLALSAVGKNPTALDQRFVDEVPIITEPEARFALQGVGVDPLSEMVWIAAINDPSLPSNVRSNLIEDLNEEGFPDHKNITVDDLPLILNRMTLIEDLLFDAMDDVNADAFLEAYKDLENMYYRVAF
ncbi:MAG TPA: hypothetical protein VM260_04650 [Pirellula sp.]|nr:hypothetical protein [Pirellula sp.]